ncbi:hypothetical protein M3D71_010080 [Micrococcus luteus]|nr:hypothetical protein [Micrococcus luteus]MCV7521171.1 hypothetical protein [Micrococcus luteus]
MTTTTPKTARQLRAEWQAEIARREAEIVAAERAEARRIDEALRRAGRARVAAVETLYEMLGIDEQTKTRTRRDGSVQTVRADLDEAERAERLVAAVAALLEGAAGTRSAPAGGAEAVPDEAAPMVPEEPAGALAPLPPAAGGESAEPDPEEDEAHASDDAEEPVSDEGDEAAREEDAYAEEPAYGTVSYDLHEAGWQA